MEDFEAAYVNTFGALETTRHIVALFVAKAIHEQLTDVGGELVSMCAPRVGCEYCSWTTGQTSLTIGLEIAYEDRVKAKLLVYDGRLRGGVQVVPLSPYQTSQQIKQIVLQIVNKKV